MPPKKSITVRGLADYMMADEAMKRRIVSQYKYPNQDEAHARIIYYREAKNAIVFYHRGGRSAVWLSTEADAIEALARRVTGRSRTRLMQNARAVRDYARNHHARRFSILPAENLGFQYGGVLVKVRPDLKVVERRVEKIVKLHFPADSPSTEEIKIISQAMFEASRQSGKNYGPSAVIFLGVGDGVEYRGARMLARMTRNIEAACLSISDIWDNI